MERMSIHVNRSEFDLVSREIEYYTPNLVINSVFLFVFCRSTIMVLGAFLDSFQKIADAATNTKGKKACYYSSLSL